MKKEALIPNMAKQQFFLRETSDQSAHETHTLKHQKVIIGRSPQADIVLDHPSISFYHCMAMIEDGALYIMDLKSHQGLIVNDQYVTEATLFDGDEIRLGELSLTLGIHTSDTDVIHNRDEQTQALTPHLKPQANIQPPPRGLVLIDDEYCDITFADHQFIPSSSDPLALPDGMDQHYIDPGHDEELTQEITLDDIARPLSQDFIRVTTLVNGTITSIDYLPCTKARIFISGRYAKAGTLFVPGLEADISMPLLTMDGSHVQVTTPQGFHSPYEEETFPLADDETIYLTKGTLQLAIERTDAPPKMKPVGFLNLEKEFIKEASKVFALFFVIMIGLLVVDTSIPEPPKKIAIIYKKAQKLKKKSDKTAKASPDKTDTNTGIKKEETPIKELELAKKTMPKKSKTKPKKSKSAPKKKMVAKKSPSKPKKSPVKAYKFNKSKLQNFMASSSNFKANAAAKSAKSATSNTFAAVSANTSADSNALSADAPTRLGRDHRGAGKRSSGTKGLSSKSGFNTIESGPRTVVLGSIDPELLRKILQEYIPQFRYCYQQELKINEAAEGVIDLAFRINAKGPISNIRVTGKKAKFSRSGVSCMAKVLRIIKFPTPKGGGVVDVKQPLNFVSERGSY